MKLSIVVPVYNVEPYVARCINSLLKQNIDDSEYEVIIVNDGSTDNSLLVVLDIIHSKSNVRLICQENMGLSVARNVGMDACKGEYIWFVDSDDWIEENCLSEIAKLLQNIDVLAMGYIEAYADYDKNKIKLPQSNVTTGRGLLQTRFIMPSQFYICKKSFLEKSSLRFYHGIYHEDCDFTPRMLYWANEILVYHSAVYFFYKRPNSITTTVNPKKAYDLIVVARNLTEFHSVVAKEYEIDIANLIGLAIDSSLQNTFFMNRNERRSFNRHLSENKDLFTYLSKSNVLKYRTEGFFFRRIPISCVTMYLIIQTLESFVRKQHSKISL
jgi:glycosyltransferase involved in cell wall biosynthesis